ncbi:hypothetical protein YC2023_113064 [Brassica napus]
MNLCIYFVLVLAVFAGTAYTWNDVEIRNQIGPNIVLHMKCHMTNPTNDLGSKDLQFNTSHTFEFRDVDTINWKKEETQCLLRYGRYYHDVQVYRESFLTRSGILHSWEARRDGIYFKTRHDRPWEFKFHWIVGK